MAGSLLSRINLARAAQIAALLLFFLPWATVSCSPRALAGTGVPDAAALANAPDVTFARATGFQLVTGTVPLSNQARADAGRHLYPFDKPDPAVAGGALLILLSLASTFLLKGRKAAIAVIAGSAASAAASSYALFIELPALARAAFTGSGALASIASRADAAELAQMIQVEAEIGFWLTIAALAGAAILAFLAIRDPAPPAATPPPDAPGLAETGEPIAPAQ
jgi:hypothetical protein